MEPQPMGKVRDLSRLAGRVAARSTRRWSSLWKFLGICLLAAVVGGPAAGLPHAQGGAAAARMPLPAQGSALLPQKITFDQPSDTTVGQPVRLSASTDASGSLVVSFRSDTPDLCTVSGVTVTPTTADVCTITASQGGSDRYAAARSMRRSFQAHTGTTQQTIRFVPPKAAAAGQSVTVSASTDAKENLGVSFRSESPMVCTVSEATLSKVTVTSIAVGACDITAFQGGSAIYAPAQASGSFQVVPNEDRIAQQISFGPVPGTTVGVPVVLTASSQTLAYQRADSATGLAVSYTSQNRRVCTVSGATVVPRTGGRCVITASQDGTAQYLPAEPITQAFPVARAPQTISFTPPTGATIGQSVTLTATASSWLPVTYTSSTPDVCTVSGATLTLTAAGTCTVTASQPGDAQYAPADSVTGSFPVGKIPQAISFTPPGGATAGRPVILTATASSGLPVLYASGSTDVCTVSGSTLTLTAAGTCTVTASQAGDDRFAAARDLQRSFAAQGGQGSQGNGNNRQTNDGPTKASQSISFGQPQAAAVGQVVPLTASASSGLAVSFQSDTPAVCSVSGATVTTTMAGTCTVTGSQAGDNNYLAAPNMTESFQVNAGHQAQTITFPAPPQAKVGEAATLAASATSRLLVAFRSDTPRICTVSGPTLIPIAAGTCTVTASQGGSDHYAAARDIAQSFDVASATSGFPGALTILLGAVVFAAAGATSLVRRVRRSHRPPEPQPTVRADPDPGPPTLVSVQNTGAGVTHTVRIESSPGASITRIKEGKS
jgi:hypothetical protein